MESPLINGLNGLNGSAAKASPASLMARDIIIELSTRARWDRPGLAKMVLKVAEQHDATPSGINDILAEIGVPVE